MASVAAMSLLSSIHRFFTPISMTPMSSTKSPTTCLELAQEGERLCRDNNFDQGIHYLRRALDVGTEDTAMLSAIYSQLGNAYYTKGLYPQALEFHRNDLLLTRFTHDELGELKASANVGHTYKAIGAYQDALMYTRHQLRLATKLPEGKERMACEARALYNLATIFQMKSRSAQKSVCLAAPPPIGGVQTAGAVASAAAASGSAESQQQTYLDDLQSAIDNFKSSLALSERLPDTLACGRTYGCLGNAYYMLRDFKTAIDFHYKRLETARQFGDKAAMRRAYTSLANAHVFLPNMERAMEFYRLALALAIEMRDDAGEAQACFALGNAASLVSDNVTARDFHMKHLEIARRLDDRAVVQVMTCRWMECVSLTRDLLLKGCVTRFFIVAVNEDESMVAATNEQIRTVMAEAGEDIVDEQGEVVMNSSLLPDLEDYRNPLRLSRSLRSLHSYADADCGLSRQLLLSVSDGDLNEARTREEKEQESEDFFDMINRLQSKRLDDQRCDPVVFSDVTNQRTRQTDQMMLSPSVSVGSIRSRRSILARLPHYASKKLQQATRGASKTSTPSASSLRSTKKGDGGGRGGQEGGFKTPSLSSLRSFSPPREATMNGSGVAHARPPLQHSSQQQRLAQSTSVLEQSSITTISEDGDGMGRGEAGAAPSPSHSTSTGSRSFVNHLPGGGMFKMPSFTRRSKSKKLSTSASLPEGPGTTSEQRRHSLYARPAEVQEVTTGGGGPGTNGPEAIMDLIMSMQGRRMEEQRAPLLPGCQDQRILQKIAKCSMRSEAASTTSEASWEGGGRARAPPEASRRPNTIPEDDISELVARMQAGRMDEQRAVLPPSPSAAAAAATPAAGTAAAQ
ncbi:ags-3 [Pristionchus pacificus]|uniref:Ags-3 n=1 Tax=Pristionchus pacificus TaxID=54126 RepID=A0A2A6BFS6_PRIPA|nr:ags-3 [Pristionchus pacificus]|eukprot:PDM64708.1 ags-3 [Pristionchus pacificus]